MSRGPARHTASLHVGPGLSRPNDATTFQERGVVRDLQEEGLRALEHKGAELQENARVDELLRTRGPNDSFTFCFRLIYSN